MRTLRGFLLCAALTFLPAMASSQPLQAELIDDLRLGGYVIVLRHGATGSDQASTDSISRKDMPAQRQLSEQGCARARSIGESMRRLKIPVALVLTSTVQRAVDTGTLLGLGGITATPDLAVSGPETSPVENNRRAQALRKLVATQPPADNNVVIVSHKPNIVDAFGKDWSDVRVGEASIFEPDAMAATSLLSASRPTRGPSSLGYRIRPGFSSEWIAASKGRLFARHPASRFVGKGLPGAAREREAGGGENVHHPH